MSSTGTYSVQKVTVQDMIDQGARACGQTSAAITAEMQESSKLALFYITQNLSNKGINLWGLDYYLFSPRKNQKYMDLPIGTNEIIEYNWITYNRTPPAAFIDPGLGWADSNFPSSNAFDGDVTTSAQQDLPGGYIGAAYNSPVKVTKVGILPKGTDFHNLIFEYSNDGTNWNVALDPPAQTLKDGVWQYWDLPIPPEATNYRVRELGAAFNVQVVDIEVSGTSLYAGDFILYNQGNEIARISVNGGDTANTIARDFYTALLANPVPYYSNTGDVEGYFSVSVSGSTISLTAPTYGANNTITVSPLIGVTTQVVNIPPAIAGTAGTISFYEVVFVEWLNTIPVVPLNRDDFFKLSSRERNTSSNSRALQYWFDRQITPRTWFWPQPSTDFQVFETIIYKQVEDVGTLSNSIAVPNRWIKYVNDALAYEMSFILPQVDPVRQQTLETRMGRSFLDADSSEEDFAPVRLSANTSAYTA